MNQAKKEHFIKLTHFLGTVLGPKYEVVFHIVEKNTVSMAAIVNNHISGRTLSSPLTSFAINLLQDKVYLHKDFVSNYKAVADSDKVIKGATFFIKNNDKLEGFICINHDTSELVETISKLIELENLGSFADILGMDDKFGAINSEEQMLSIEKLDQSIEDILQNHLDPELLVDNKKSLSISQKENIVKLLLDKGIFRIKGAIPIVSKHLNISEPSVYRYLKKLK